jgi:D-alanyl-D-alanine carboxypeptidase
MNLLFASELGISKSSIKARGLREFEEATELGLVERDEDGKEHLLVPTAAQAWRLLKAAALAEGASLFIVSAFRSIERQAELVRRKLAAGQTIEEILHK